MKMVEEKKGGEKKADEITEWLTKSGRKTLDLEAARQLASESPDHWYIALQGAKGYVVGKMTMQKYSARHILVDEKGEPMLFLTAEAAKRFLLKELNIQSPHVFSV
jgi:glucose/arabinose dehydrogenase